MKKKLGIYSGTFNPLHKGHLDILLKVESIFDEVVVAIGVNPEKEIDKNISRLETLKLQLPGKKVEEFSGFLVDYVHQKEIGGYDVTIVRGLRNGADLDYEVNQLRVMQDQHPGLKMIFIPCSRGLEHISSSMIRSLEKIQIGAASEYLVKPEMFDKSEFAPRMSVSERYNYKELIKKYDLEKVKEHFITIIKYPAKSQCDTDAIKMIKKDLESEDYISLIFNHMHYLLRDSFLKETKEEKRTITLKIEDEEFHQGVSGKTTIKQLNDINNINNNSTYQMDALGELFAALSEELDNLLKKKE